MSESPPEAAKNPEFQAISKETDQYVTVVSDFKITTVAEYSDAGEQLKKVKGAMKRLEDLRFSITRPMDAAKNAVMQLFAGPEQKLKQAETGIKKAMIAYDDEQERIRKAEQARLEEVARKERERIELQAKKAEQKGKTEKAAELQERAAMVVAPVVQAQTTKVSGVSTRDNWKAECTDLMALVKAVAEGKAPLAFVMANDKQLNGQARLLKQDFTAPGVRVWNDKGIAAGAA